MLSIQEGNKEQRACPLWREIFIAIEEVLGMQSASPNGELFYNLN